MFTVDQIKAAHSKVKSGADFPAYIQEIKQLGVTAYETFVTDGHTDYYGMEDYQVTSPARFETMEISAVCQAEQFKPIYGSINKAKQIFLPSEYIVQIPELKNGWCEWIT
jgi:L-rhamnose mutarotase